MKAVIAGGSGQIGRILCRDFLDKGWDVVVLGRGSKPQSFNLSSTRSRGSVRYAQWDGKTPGAWWDELESADVVINLAGRSVNCRYNPANQRAIIDSRVDSTRAITEAIANAKVPPKLLLQSSTATIYSHRFDKANDDVDGEIGGREPEAPPKWNFSIRVATSWEAAAMERELPETRRVLMRSAITLSPDRGGIFDVLLRLVRFGLGGTNGNGKQYVSWIHEHDFINAVHWLIEHEEVDGPINLSSPCPIPNADFMRTLRKAWGQPIGLPASRWMLAVGAVLLGTETELILKSRRVTPRRLLDRGFEFQFPNWQDAAEDLCSRWRVAGETT